MPTIADHTEVWKPVDQFPGYEVSTHGRIKSEWDYDLLAVEFEQLDEMGFDTELTGFDQSDLDNFIGESAGDGTFGRQLFARRKAMNSFFVVLKDPLVLLGL